MREVKEDDRSERFSGIQVGNEEIEDLRYADDTALMSNTTDGLRNLIDTVKEKSEGRGLKLNVKKTKIMDIKRSQNISNVYVDGQKVENVSSFEYLGALIDNDGDGSKEVKRRLAMAVKKLNDMEHLWSSTSKDMKLRVLNTCIFPTAYYGSEAWVFTQNICQRIDAFEMKCYRKILNVSWREHRTNISVAKELGIKMGSLLSRIKTQKLKYFGHITRHESLEKSILECNVNGKRKAGRPRRRWEDDITDWLGIGLHQARRLAQDRKRFRAAVGAATSLPG